jgi:hypothetical protein
MPHPKDIALLFSVILLSGASGRVWHSAPWPRARSSVALAMWSAAAGATGSTNIDIELALMSLCGTTCALIVLRRDLYAPPLWAYPIAGLAAAAGYHEPHLATISTMCHCIVAVAVTPPSP